MTDEMKLLGESLAAFVPEQTEGVLFVRYSSECTQDMLEHMARSLPPILRANDVHCGVVFVRDDIELQMLSDGQLRDIGFERIRPKADITDVTRSFAG